MDVRAPFLRCLLDLTGRRRLKILVYHRVLPTADGLYPSAIDAPRFDEQLSWMRSILRLLPLAEAIEMLREGRLPARATSITFDDGYADNATIALPLLKR